MVSVTYYCPYCEALTSLERDAYMADKCVTKEPLAGWEYASTTGEYEAADGVEFVCLGDADDEADAGCGRTFYLSFVKYEAGEPVEHRVPDIDKPRFDFLR
ncbi:hypothetical protein [Haloarchaeobius sp. FL176]|uniref:hypothetical protein n=1 Tax=Haloarchaeobius sp. FL176 TaxID=2967129 RepID=UPI0021489821|nr:hypothetical protein [Haloarchaeobius sp. FL176]